MSGLERSKKILSHLNEIAVVDFDHSDVVRHPLVSKLLKRITIMIKVNVFSEENLGQKVKKKEIFFNQICKHFPKKFRFINKKVYLTITLK